jgi:hypothetical protein
MNGQYLVYDNSPKTHFLMLSLTVIFVFIFTCEDHSPPPENLPRWASGVLSGASPGVLETVAYRRIRNNWGLTPNTNPAHYEALIATPHCNDLGKYGLLIVGNKQYKILVVDCAQPIHREKMLANGLLADVNLAHLWHKTGRYVLFDNLH